MASYYLSKFTFDMKIVRHPLLRAEVIKDRVGSLVCNHVKLMRVINSCRGFAQSYVIKSAPWTILWFRILGTFSVEDIKRLCVFMFQTCSNSQLLRRVL